MDRQKGEDICPTSSALQPLRSQNRCEATGTDVESAPLIQRHLSLSEGIGRPHFEQDEGLRTTSAEGSTQRLLDSNAGTDVGIGCCTLSAHGRSHSNQYATSIPLHSFAESARRDPMPRKSDTIEPRYASIGIFSPWIPNIDPIKQAKAWRTRRSRLGALLLFATSMSLSVLVVNIVATIFVRSNYKSTRGVVPMYQGSCSWVKNVDTGLHVLINVLSTLLLGASNLCMQLLAAPTRNEIDAAHAKHKWLDIGVPSWRNLKSVGRIRQVMWWCLVLSSVPLHFIYNSAFSSSLASFGYGGAVVTENFIAGPPWAAWGNIINDTRPDYYGSPEYYSVFDEWPKDTIWNHTQALVRMQRTAQDPEITANLSKVDCWNLYNDVFRDRTNFLLVTGGPSEVDGPALLEYKYQPAEFKSADGFWNWMCDNGGKYGSCGVDERNITEGALVNWTTFGRPVAYCLSQKRTEEFCRLNYSPAIMIAICLVSSFKCSCIALTAWYFHHRSRRAHMESDAEGKVGNASKEIPLCTLGDAISSFLDMPDKYTRHMGLASQVSLNKEEAWHKDAAEPIEWHPTASSWYKSASKRRWAFTASVYGLAVISASAMMASGVGGTMERSKITFWAILHRPLGFVQPDSFTGYFLPRGGTKGFIANVLYANCWQMVISMLYFAYNALLTCQLVSKEWSGYSRERKALRVSHPMGMQRSNYFVSMPVKYGLPLLAANATLHWLVSQSIFVVNTTTYYPNSIEDYSHSFTITGYSSSAAFASIFFGLFMLICFGLNSWRKLPEGMPLVSTCSAAISAACHRPKEDEDAYLLPVKWGVIPDSVNQDEHRGHRCAFTTLREVEGPVRGERYMGLPERYHTNNEKNNKYKFWQRTSILRRKKAKLNSWVVNEMNKNF